MHLYPGGKLSGGCRHSVMQHAHNVHSGLFAPSLDPRYLAIPPLRTAIHSIGPGHCGASNNDVAFWKVYD